MARAQAGRDGAFSRTYANAGIRSGRWCYKTRVRAAIPVHVEDCAGQQVGLLALTGQNGMVDGGCAQGVGGSADGGLNGDC